MKILRKRVGSLELDNLNSIRIINDSILSNEDIIFNYLPIKNLIFFNLKLNKSNLNNKYWIYLDLNLSLLYKEIYNGKIIINRNLIFDLINSSLNRLKINREHIEFINYKEFKEDNLLSNNFFEVDQSYGYDKSFVKYGKIYFNIEKKLITINKCKKQRIKIPSIFIFQNYFEIRKLFMILLNEFSIENHNSLFIIEKKDNYLLESKIFNPYFDDNLKNVIFSEDLNFQMENYLNDLNNEEFLNQLEFESENFFFKKKNIFIITNNLCQSTISYLSRCKFERIFIVNYQNIEKTLIGFVDYYNKYRINLNEEINNILISDYILSKKLFKYKPEVQSINFLKYKIENFPLMKWNEVTNLHFLSLDNSIPFLSNFIKIGEKNNWSVSSLNEFKNLNNLVDINDKCPISLSPLNYFSVQTECSHYFNLNHLLKWLDDNDECPICRKKITLKNLKFICSPDISDFIRSLYDFNNKLNIIVDGIWLNKFSENKLFSKRKNNLKLINQLDFINGKFRKDKLNTTSFILNLSSLTFLDILFVNEKLKYNQDIIFLKLIN